MNFGLTNPLQMRIGFNVSFIKLEFWIITILLTTACTKNNHKTDKIKDSRASELSTTEDPYFKLGKNLSDFRSHFNSFSGKSGSELRISNFKITPESVYNTFEYSFNNKLKIIGQLNRSDSTIHAINVT